MRAASVAYGNPVYLQVLIFGNVIEMPSGRSDIGGLSEIWLSFVGKFFQHEARVQV